MRGIHDRGLERERRIDRTIVFVPIDSVRTAVGDDEVGIGIAVGVPQLEEVQFRSGVQIDQRNGGCGIERIGNKSQRTKVSSGLVVLEPKDLTACEKGNNDVQIAILIQVGDHRMIGLTAPDAIEISTGFSRKDTGTRSVVFIEVYVVGRFFEGKASMSPSLSKSPETEKEAYGNSLSTMLDPAEGIKGRDGSRPRAGYVTGGISNSASKGCLCILDPYPDR